jgi:hypothetical protein
MLLRHEAELGGKIAPPPKHRQIGSEGFDGKSCHRADAWHGLGASRQAVFFGRVPHLLAEIRDPSIQAPDLFQIYPAEFANVLEQRRVIILDRIGKAFEVCRPSRSDQAMLGKMPA